MTDLGIYVRNSEYEKTNVYTNNVVSQVHIT